MAKEDKLQAALELQELRPWGASKLPADMPAELRELRDQHLARMRKVMAELHAEHFSEQQLRALLDFYGSEVGKSIVETEREISEHFNVRMQELARELNEEAAKKSSGIIGSWSGDSAKKGRGPGA